MIEDIITQVGEIFVGRQKESQRLEALWNLALKEKEHRVYVFLNAPGVGKTTLINHFGKKIEVEGQGLFIRFVCSSDFDSPARLNKTLIKTIDKKIYQNYTLIEEFINRTIKEKRRERMFLKLERLQSFISELLTKITITLNDIRDVFDDLAEIIPIFFPADEIQEFQKLIFISIENEEETALHYYTRVLKDLLNSRILLLLSGTRYHILRQIGFKIGSPIREKVKSLIIQKFEPEEVNAYVEQVQLLIEGAQLEYGLEKIPALLDNYRTFLFAFSGGHPRTIENVTELFLRHLLFLVRDDKYQDYNEFMNFLLPLTSKTLKTMLFSKEKEEKILELSASTQFSIVKDWILKGGQHGLFLGQAPEVAENYPANEEINSIIYDLMNIGVLVQNGMLNYHLTSYFYFIGFLQPFVEPHELFLKQILNNKFFKQMCGHHAGFGYTFENIFLSALLIYGMQKEKALTLPLKTSLITSLKVIKGKIEWTDIEIQPNMLYHSPEAEAVDVFVLQENMLLLVQITTANPPPIKKLDNLSSLINALSETTLNIEKFREVRGWFVSLFDFKRTPPISEGVVITTGEDLSELLGKELYIKLKEVKNSFRV